MELSFMSEERYECEDGKKKKRQTFQFCKKFWQGSLHREVQSNKFLLSYMICCAVQVDYEAEL